MKKLYWLLPLLFLSSISHADIDSSDNTDTWIEESPDALNNNYQGTTPLKYNELSDRESKNQYEKNMEELAALFKHWYDKSNSKFQKQSIKFAEKMIAEKIFASCTGKESVSIEISAACAATEVADVSFILKNDIIRNPDDFIKTVFQLIYNSTTDIFRKKAP